MAAKCIYYDQIDAPDCEICKKYCFIFHIPNISCIALYILTQLPVFESYMPKALALRAQQKATIPKIVVDLLIIIPP